MQQQKIQQLLDQYRNELLGSIMPFWEEHSIDQEYGGYIHYLGTKGDVIGDDKAMWLQARQCWMFAKLYNDVESRPQWLNYAKLGYDFIRQHGFDDRGKMYFSVTRDGQPLRMRRYYFSETFFIIACAEYSKAANDQEAMNLADTLFSGVKKYYLHPDPQLLPPKVDPVTRPAIGIAPAMILLATAQVMRDCMETDAYDDFMAELAETIMTQFVKDDWQAVMEMVAPDGSIIDTPEGRTLNPGHAIEAAWFLMHEGIYRDDQAMIERALQMLDWSFERGWDKEMGGMLSFVDLKHLPPEKMEWDMKYWWPHNETLYATLLAHYLTGDTKYEAMFDQVHDYAQKHFSDPDNGEWFGYLHRDGSIAMEVKGTMFKGAFHVPRQYLLCVQLLEHMLAEEGA